MHKLTFFDATLKQGGAERVISIVTKELAKDENLKVNIVLWYKEPLFYEIDSRVQILFVSEEAKSNIFLKKLLWLHNFMKNETDAVVSFLAPINMIAIVSNFFTRCKLIVADRNDPSKVPVNKLIRKMRDILYEFADGVVVQTKKNQLYFSKRIQEKSTVIYNPVNMRNFARISLHGEKEKRIVSVGRLAPQKNQKMLLRAFANVLKKYPEYKLEIYGDKYSYTSELEELIHSLGINEQVLLAGSVTNLHEQIQNAEIFALSSNYEGMPNALIEAMCMGLPVISTKVSGATDLIEHGKNGLLVDVDDQFAMEEAIVRLLGDADLRKKFAENAVKLNEQLEVSKIVDQWKIFIEEKCFG